jgi:O-antigen biosynthesis protein WbqP
LIRIFDIFLSFFGLIIFSPLLLIITIICYFDTGSPIFLQKRVGRYQRSFVLIKFRTMKLDTASVPTHLVSVDSITKIGFLFRKIKLDELPQLWNVLTGDMSFVGPRPGLYNQLDLIHEREKRNIYSYRPGITGLAQIKKIDMSTPILLADTDKEMFETLNLRNYFKYIFKTISVMNTYR